MPEIPLPCDHVVAELTEAFQLHRAAVFNVARRLCGAHLAADVTQEVFLRVWRQPDQFDASRGSVRQYLLTVTRHVAIDHLRRDSARRRRDTRHVDGVHEVDNDIIQGLIDAENATRVAVALDELDAVQRESIVAAFYGHETYREVAARLGVPEGTVKSRIRVGFQKLRPRLEEVRDMRPVASVITAER